jgi:hypothetical protein
MPHLEKDPLLSKDSDFVPSMEGLDGYTLRSQKTFLQGVDKVNISEGTKNLVSKFVKKIKQQ